MASAVLGPVIVCTQPFRARPTLPRRHLAVRDRKRPELALCGLGDPHGSEGNIARPQNTEEIQSSLRAATTLDPPSYSPDAALLQRERLLWERQEALWQQQLSHWQHERNIWAQREATLLEHIQQLHSQMTTLLSQHTNSPNQTDRATLSATNPSNKQAEQRVVASFAASDPTTLDAQPSPPSLTPSQSAGSESAATQQPAAQNDAPTGPPPTLCTDSDDIYWVNQLQTSLANKGYYCGEEESEDFVFGTNTESAVMTFQACSGLEDSGVVDDQTWKALLGEDMAPTAPPIDEELLEEEPVAVEPLSRESPAGPSQADKKRTAKDPNPWQASWGDLFTTGEDSSDESTSQTTTAALSPATRSDLDSAATSASSDTSAETTTAASSSKPSGYVNQEMDYSKWTVLREGDGGRHVHELQVALAQKGFWPGDDDMLWWQFGDTTCSAVQTFQATADLPQSGVATSDTWQALLGKDAKPADAAKLVLDDETDDDMTADHGGVYLVGEQRWAKV